MSSSTLCQRGVRDRVRKTWKKRKRKRRRRRSELTSQRDAARRSASIERLERRRRLRAADDTSNIIHERGKKRVTSTHIRTSRLFVFLSTSLPRATSLNGNAGSPQAPSRLLPRVAFQRLLFICYNAVSPRYPAIAIASMLTHSDLEPRLFNDKYE